MRDETYLVGRDKKRVDICLGDSSISGVHLEITVVGRDEVLVEDKKSTNGTFKLVKGVKRSLIKETMSLKDSIYLGDYKVNIADLVGGIKKNQSNKQGVYIRDENGFIVEM